MHLGDEGAVFDGSVAEEIAKRGNDPQYGARPLRRAVMHLVEDRLSDALLSGELKLGDSVRIYAQNGEILIGHGAELTSAFIKSTDTPSNSTRST